MNMKLIDKMKHSPLLNYAGIPGLTSWLIGEKSSHGCVRLFECERNHDEHIIPHSHRFDFECHVLAGSVWNVIYLTHDGNLAYKVDVDRFARTELVYGGQCGAYQLGDTTHTTASRVVSEFDTGSSYSMRAHEIHSIYFSKGAKVLFFEGPQLTDRSVILEPVTEVGHIKTFKVEPWMFQKPQHQDHP